LLLIKWSASEEVTTTRE